MATWNEIAEDHYIALSWSRGLNADSDGYSLSPPCSDPSFSGGLDLHFARIAQHQLAQRRVNPYRCKFCRSLIGFVNRKPLNLVDGSPHRCLADAAAARATNTSPATGGGEGGTK